MLFKPRFSTFTKLVEGILKHPKIYTAGCAYELKTILVIKTTSGLLLHLLQTSVDIISKGKQHPMNEMLGTKCLIIYWLL